MADKAIPTIQEKNTNVGIGTSSPAYKLDVYGDIGGTGLGDRITLNGTGYLLSGDSPAETQTLQQVCDNDNSTTTSILSTGPHISGVTGLFSDAVCIGTDAPNAGIGLQVNNGAFYVYNGDAKLDEIDAGYFASSRDLVLKAGTAAAVQLQAGSTKILTAKYDGTVGIGTDSPTETLHVSGGDVLIQGTNLGYIKALKERASVADYLSVSSSILALTDYNATNEYGIYVNNAGSFSVSKSGSANAIVIDNNHITVTGYNLKFDSIQYAYSPAINLRGSENGDEVGIYSPATNKFSIVTDRLDRVIVDAVGNVGIGSASPAAQLDVVGTGLFSEKVGIGTDAPDTMLQVYAGDIKLSSPDTPSQPFTLKARYGGFYMVGDGSATCQWIMMNSFGHDAGFHFNYTPGTAGATGGIMTMGQTNKNASTYTHGVTAFYTDGTERLRIDGVGNVGIGSANPQILLDVNDTTASDNKCIAKFEGQGTGASTDDGGQYINVCRTGPIGQANGAMGGIYFGQSSNPMAAGAIVRGNYKYLNGRDLEFLTSTGNSSSPELHMVVKGDGSVGIGTKNPNALLEINDNIPRFSLYDTATSKRWEINKAYGGLNFAEIGVADMRLFLKDGGGVGIGVDPTEDFEVFQAGKFKVDASDSPIVYISNNSATVSTAGTATLKFQQGSTAAGGSIIGGRDSNYSNGATRRSYMAFLTATAAVDTEKMRITSSGHVGIGTNSPSYTLDVAGDVGGTGVGDRITLNGTPYLLSGDSPAETQTLQDVTDNGSTTSNSISVTGSDGSVLIGPKDITINRVASSYGPSIIFQEAGTKTWNIKTDSDGGNADRLQFSNAAGATALTIEQGGNVGIGKQDPSYILDVNSSTTDQVARFKSSDADAFISIEDNYDSVYIGHSSGDNVMSLGFSSTMGSTSNVSINPQGYVGIGTSNPLYKLEATSSVGGDWISRIYNTNANGYGLLVKSDSTNNNPAFGVYGNGAYRLTVLSSGNVGIGTSAPSEALQVEGNVYIHNSNATLKIQEGTAEAYTFVAGGTSLDIKADSTTSLSIYQNGYVGIGTDVPAASLDVDGTFRIRSNQDSDDWIQWQGVHSDGRLKLRDNNDNNIIQLSTAYNIQAFGEGEGSGQGGIGDWAFMSRNNMATAAGLNIGSDNGTAGTHKSLGISTPQCNSIYGKGGPSDDYIELETYSIAGNTWAGERPAIRMAASGYEFYANTDTHGFAGSPHFSINEGGYSYFTGQVGIGTTAPERALHVVGHILLDNNYEIRQKDSGGSERTILELDSSNNFNVGGSYAGDLIFRGASYAEKMRMKSNGDVGIGTSAPSGELHVEGDIVLSSGSSLKSIGGQGFQTLGFYSPPAGAGTIYTALEVGGQEFFEPRTANRSYLYGFNSVGFKPTADCSKAGSATIGFGDPADAYPVVCLTLQDNKVQSTTSRTLELHGYNGILFTQTAGSPPPLGFWSKNGLGVLNDSPQYALDVSGDVAGTGAGDRITLGGTPYLLSGDSPAETQTLQDVCNNGNTTTGSILSTGPHISGVTGLFSERVGIGVTDPDERLEVAGNIKFSSDGNQLRAADGNTLLNELSNVLTLGNAGTTITNIHGDVGIGTAVPNGALHVNVENTRQLLFTRSATGPSASDGTYMGQGSTDFSIVNQEAGSLRLGTSNTNRLTIEAGGDVGIGTTNPTTKLNIVIDDAQDAGAVALLVQNATGDCRQEIYGANDNTAGTYASNRAGAALNLRNVDIAAGNYSLLGFQNAAGYSFGGIHGVCTIQGVTDVAEGKLEFYTRNATDNYRLSMTLDESGRLGIGTDAIVNPTETLTVDGNIKIADTDKSIIGYTDTESIRFYNPTNEIILSAATAVRFAADIRIAGNHAVENNDGDQYWQFYDSSYDGFAQSLRFNVPIVVETSEQPILMSRTNLEFRIDSNDDSTSSKFFVTRDTGEATVDELFTIVEDGNVGIGTNAPAHPLHVRKSVGSSDEVARFESTDRDAFISIADNATTGYLGVDGGYPTLSLGFDTNMASTSNLSIDTDGFVGIGTYNPKTHIHIQSETGSITIGSLNSKGASLDTYYGVTDPAGDIVGTYHEQTSVLTENGSPSLRGSWTNHKGSYAEDGATWSGPSLIGFYAEQHINTASHRGTISNQYGFRASAGINSCGAGGTVTNAYGVYIKLRNNDSDGTVHNSYGVYINDTDTAGASTNRWGIYSEGSATKNYFEGKVGVGVTNPTYAFETNSASAIKLSSTTASISIGSSWGDGVLNLKNGVTVFTSFDIPNGKIVNNLGKYLTASSNAAQFGTQDGYDATFVVSGVEKMRIDTDGNVGIGTDDPDHIFHVQSAGSPYAAVESTDAGAAQLKLKNTAGAFGWRCISDTLNAWDYNDGRQIMTLDGAGNVGIGTTSPQTELHVEGAIKGGFSLSAKSADFTLAASDNGEFINGTSASFDQITISSDLGADFNVGVMNTGANVVIGGTNSMIINGIENGSVTLASGYQPASIVRLTANTYAVFGNLI